MVSVFVSAEDNEGTYIADHYRFATVPDIGHEILIVEGQIEYLLKVEGVTHQHESTGDTLTPISYVAIKAKLIHKLDLDAS